MPGAGVEREPPRLVPSEAYSPCKENKEKLKGETRAAYAGTLLRLAQLAMGYFTAKQ